MNVRFTKYSKDPDVEFKLEDKREVLAEVDINSNILNDISLGGNIVLNDSVYKIDSAVIRIEKTKIPVYYTSTSNTHEEKDVFILEVILK